MVTQTRATVPPNTEDLDTRSCPCERIRALDALLRDLAVIRAVLQRDARKSRGIVVVAEKCLVPARDLVSSLVLSWVIMQL